MYRAGIVGLGVGKRHAGAYTGSNATGLVAIADLDAALLDEVGRDFDVPHRYTSLEAMLEHETLDIVSVATPCQFHAPMVIAAAEVAVGLGILVAVFRNRASTDVDTLAELRL